MLKGPIPSTKYTTTYTSWDSKGRPTVGTTAHPGGRTTTAIAYNDAGRTQTTTSATGGARTVCQMTFDADGNATATSCKVDGTAQTGSKTTIAKTDTICR
jgi:YD repeat-containing protein